MGALTALNEGERVVARLMLRSLGPDWSQPYLDKAHKRPGMEPREPAYTFQTKPLQMDGITMAVLGIGALAALKGYLWVQDGEIWKAALLGTVTALGLVVVGWGWWRWKKARKRVEDPILIQEKVSRIAFDAELHVTAIVPSRTGPQRAGELLGPVAAAYRHYDNPAGARFKVGKVRPIAPDRENLHPPGPGLFGGRSVLGSGRSPPCGTRPERRTRRRWWSGPARGRSARRRREPGAARWWETPPREPGGRSAFPQTCCAVTTSMWPARAWASQP